MSADRATLQSSVRDYLAGGKLLHLATSNNNLLWLCHVWYALGPEPFSLVFTSNIARRHCEDIGANHVVAGGVVAMDLEGLGQKVRGASFEGHAFQAVGDQISPVYESYAKRWPRVREMFSAGDIRNETTKMRMFHIDLKKVVLFDEVNSPDQPRQELIL